MVPRCNRVDPTGALLAVPDRGLFWGSRGCLVDAAGEMARFSSGRMWLICVLDFKGRRRVQWQPRRLTELYFLDEATGLAAGHRPCGECRNRDYREFRAAFSTAFPDDPRGVAGIDARLHADRLAGRGARRVLVADSGALPTGAMVRRDGACWLVRGDRLLPWSPGGYGPSVPYPGEAALEVLTPAATVAVLAGGYRPVLHPSALGADQVERAELSASIQRDRCAVDADVAARSGIRGASNSGPCGPRI